jgi:hypothetical protein
MTAAAAAHREQDLAVELDRLDRWARFLDAEFRVPGTTIRIGWDPILGLIPGIGDLATTILALYLPFQAWRLGAGWRVVGTMLINVLLDSLIGLIPLFGDVFDAVFHCNIRNARLLREAHNDMRRA